MTNKEDFEQVLIDAGIPITDESIKSAWDEIVKNQGFVVENNSPFSPFWRLIKAIASQPALQVADLLTEHIMPNTFMLTSNGQWLDNHGAGRNTSRLTALKTQGNVKITRIAATEELIIPAGTIIESSPINNIVYQVKTLYDTTLAIGELTKITVVEAITTGPAQNLTGGYYNTFAVPIEGVSVVNPDNWIISAGQDIESDDNYKLRQRDKFATLGNFHVDAVYRSIISEFPGILADNIIFDHSAPRGPGSANAYVYLQVGTISPAVVDSINNHIASGYHGHGDDLLVFAIPTTDKDIELEYWLKPNEADIQTEIEQFIRAAFRENSAYTATTCKPTETFSFSILAAELHAQFPQISSLNFVTTDFNTGISLAVIDTLTVTNMA